MICLTFDSDHMTESSMELFLQRFSIPGNATFFCHQPFSCLGSAGYEVGIHPYLTDLAKTAEVLRTLANSVGGKISGVRTHSCVTSHLVDLALKEQGFLYSSVFSSGDASTPFKKSWGIWELPIHYMDNMDFSFGVHWRDSNHVPFDGDIWRRAMDSDEVYVFDFHPIHLALNTVTLDSYMKWRKAPAGTCPFAMTGKERGARTLFEEMIEAAVQRSLPFLSAEEVVRQYMAKNS